MKGEIVVKEQVEKSINEELANLKNKGFAFPRDYNPRNALAAAWLTLLEAKDKDKRPVLQTCTQDSIKKALLDMLIQGLNPSKEQCYFIAYGNQLVCQRSYFGSMLLAKRVRPDIAEIRAQVVYKGDEFETEFRNGRIVVTKHKQNIENVRPDNIVAAYCVVVDKEDNVIKTEIMSISQIKQAWRKSKNSPVLPDGTLRKGTAHEEFTEEMCKRTVINRACKAIINSSGDMHLIEAATRAEIVQAEEEVKELQAKEPETVDIEQAKEKQPIEVEGQEQKPKAQPEAEPETEEIKPPF